MGAGQGPVTTNVAGSGYTHVRVACLLTFDKLCGPWLALDGFVIDLSSTSCRAGAAVEQTVCTQTLLLLLLTRVRHCCAVLLGPTVLCYIYIKYNIFRIYIKQQEK